MSIGISQNHVSGFQDPARDAQRVFRAVLGAMARPTIAQNVAVTIAPPPPLGTMAGAVVLALCDSQSPVWLDPALRVTSDVEAWIAFHTGAGIVDDPADALFVFASTPSAAPALADLAQGTDIEPHRSSTLVIDATAARPIGTCTATGPGVDGSVEWDGAGLPGGFLKQWQANHTRFPRGVDVILAAENSLLGLPRTTELKEKI